MPRTKNGRTVSLTAEEARERATGQGPIRARSDEEIERAASEDEDAPLLTEAQLASGHVVETPGKVAVSLRIDRAVLEAYKATGRGWQTRMNDALVAAMRDGIDEQSDPIGVLERTVQGAIDRLRMQRSTDRTSRRAAG